MRSVPHSVKMIKFTRLRRRKNIRRMEDIETALKGLKGDPIGKILVRKPRYQTSSPVDNNALYRNTKNKR